MTERRTDAEASMGLTLASLPSKPFEPTPLSQAYRTVYEQPRSSVLLNLGKKKVGTRAETGEPTRVNDRVEAAFSKAQMAISKLDKTEACETSVLLRLGTAAETKTRSSKVECNREHNMRRRRLLRHQQAKERESSVLSTLQNLTIKGEIQRNRMVRNQEKIDSLLALQQKMHKSRVARKTKLQVREQINKEAPTKKGGFLAALTMDKTEDPEYIKQWYEKRLKRDKELSEKFNASLKDLNVSLKPKDKLMPKITEDEEAIYQKGMFGGSDSEIVVDIFNVSLERGKLNCLAPGSWLNDEVINIFMKLLRAYSVENSNKNGNESFSQCYFFSSFFYTQLYSGAKSYEYSKVRRWTKRGSGKCDIFSQRRVFVPHNVHNTHWCLGVIEIPEKRIVYYDSMGGRGSQFLSHLLQYLCDESSDKKKNELDSSQWELVSMGHSTPQQNNGYDCGVFTCVSAYYLSLGRSLSFKNSDMPYFRKRLCIDILKECIVLDK